MQLQTFDIRLIHFFRNISIPLARCALFVIFFWFGALKVVGLSPAADLVKGLYEQTIPFLPFATFYLLFALFECLIGILFLIPRAERIVLPLLLLHMVTTFLPLFLLPAITWQSFLVPTLEGQYIIKNVVIIATAIFIAANTNPLPAKIS
jgi:uncharacterized membrane protein YkgB